MMAAPGEGARRPIPRFTHGPPGAPTVVCTHGVTLDHHAFDGQIQPLQAAGHRIVTWDLPGHGAERSSGDAFTLAAAVVDLAALLAELDDIPVALVGQSFAGFVAQPFTQRAPGRITALVLIATPPLTGRPPWHHRVFSRMRPLLLRLWPEAHLRRVLPTFLSQRHDVQHYVDRATRQLSKSDLIAVTRAAVGPLLSSRAPTPARSPCSSCAARTSKASSHG